MCYLYTNMCIRHGRVMIKGKTLLCHFALFCYIHCTSVLNLTLFLQSTVIGLSGTSGLTVTSQVNLVTWPDRAPVRIQHHRMAAKTASGLMMITNCSIVNTVAENAAACRFDGDSCNWKVHSWV